MLYTRKSRLTARQQGRLIEYFVAGATARAAAGLLEFPVLSDPGAALADRFGIAHTIPEHVRKYFRSIMVNIPYSNAGLGYETATEASWRLPLPGLF